MGITGSSESTTSLITGLYNNGAIDRASIEFHYDTTTPEQSTAEFGSEALVANGWFGAEMNPIGTVMGIPAINAWNLNLYGTDNGPLN